MSFFDETDEPPPTRRARPPAGTSRRPPSVQQTIMVRRAVAGAAILIVVIVLAIGVHSCQVSSRNSALKNYNTTVGALVKQSDSTGRNLFNILSTANATNTGQGTLPQNELVNAAHSAQSQLQQAQSLSPPVEVSNAQQNFVLALSLRQSGISDIASHIGEALSRGTARTGIDAIAADMEKFLASDVVYTTQTAAGIAVALHAAGIAVGGANGETIQATTFLPDLGWLTPSFIARMLGTSVGSSSSSSSSSASGAGTCPSVCGHKLNSVSVGGVALSTGGGNTIPASPAPTFTASFTNTGQNPETSVTVQAKVTTSSGATITANAVQPTTSPGQTYTVQIPLPKAPPAGSAQVVVMVERVAGETTVARNRLTFPVTFA